MRKRKPTKLKKFSKPLTFSQIFSVYTSFTLTVAVYSTLELFKFKSNEYQKLLKQLSLVKNQDDVFDETPVLDEQYADADNLEVKNTRPEKQNPSNEMQAMIENMKAMKNELQALKQGKNFGVESFAENRKIDDYQHERQGCNIRMADRGEFTNVPLLSFPGSGNTWTRYK